MVAGFVKSFQIPFDEVLEMPYINIILYSKVLPTYTPESEKGKTDVGKVITDKAEYNAYIRKLTGKTK